MLKNIIGRASRAKGVNGSYSMLRRFSGMQNMQSIYSPNFTDFSNFIQTAATNSVSFEER